MTLVEASKYHYPCWSLVLNEGQGEREKQFTVWAPGEVSNNGQLTGETREHWAASWASNFGEFGSYVSGQTLDDVLRIFPPRVADQFRVTIEQQWKEA